MKTSFTLLFFSTLIFASNFSVCQGTQLLRQPTLSDDHIVFVYANDLWIVDKNGGSSKRLTSNEGSESNPHFAPDGSVIAFSGQYEGNTDVYTVPVQGGVPERLTWHPSSDIVQGWTPDGKILFRSSRNGHPTETNSFYSVDLSGGYPTALNIPRAAYGEISSDGRYAAYTPITSWDPEWRNYRGGQAMPVWIQDLQSGELVRTPQGDLERHLDPVWVGDEVYYLSERDYTSNIWSYDKETNTERQITFHKMFDVKSLDANNGEIVYEQGGYLHLLDARGSARQLEIHVKGDMNFSIPRWEDVTAQRLTNAAISPTGKRALFEFRGEIISFPKKNGSPRNLTKNSGIAERSPSWSPKGSRIAYFSDASGEYELVISDQYGKVEKTIGLPSGTFYFRPEWSPDGKKIAFTDTDYNIWMVTIESGVSDQIDTDRYAHPNRTMNPVWSPSSRYIAYAKQQESHFKSLFIYDTETRTVHQVTDGLADVITPVFDQNGEHLYYLASTDYGLNSGWLDMSSYDPEVTRTLYVLVLQKDGASPFLPKSDEEEAEEEEEDADDGEAANGDETLEEAESDTTNEDSEKVIDFDEIILRSIAVPDVSGEYVALDRAPEGNVLIAMAGERGVTVKKYGFEKQELDDFVKGVSQLRTSYDGAFALYRNGGKWSISSISGKPDPQKDVIPVDFKVRVDPLMEYQQIFKEGWRFMRDFLYVDNVHGAPWNTIWEWYSPWIDHVRHRSDLNYVVDILSGEVAVGHSYVFGGDLPDIDRVGVGLLGADYELDNGLYRIAKIYTGEQWNHTLKAPLHMPGLDINEGDYIVRVNGTELTADQNIFSHFEQTAGKHVQLTVKSELNGEEKSLIVVPVSSEGQLRTFDWIEDNRRRVDELSDGQLAYVYVPNTGGSGFAYFNRYYFSQQDKKGVVIDERNNGGGSAADYMIDIMNRQLFGYFNSKANDNRPWTTPMAGIWGPKVMIINERAGSGGDLLPYMFKKANIGPLVGTRTWGGLVGTWDTPPFIDGGRMIAPRGGFFDIDGEWAVEGEGIQPDIEIIMDPELVLKGQDPQLEGAVREAMRLLDAERFELKPEPDAPVRWKRPEGWENGQ